MNGNGSGGKQAAGVRDSQLIWRLARYAFPYWKQFVLCVVLAFLVVSADIGRTYLIKIAIDDHINGYVLPMAAAESPERLRSVGLEPLSAEIDGLSFARVGHEPDDVIAAGLAKFQIVDTVDRSYLISGWIPAGETDAPVVTEGEGGSYAVSFGDSQTFPARALSEAEKDAFQTDDYAGFWRLGGIFLIAVVGAAMLSVWQMNVLQYAGQGILYTIRDQLFRHLAKMPMSFYDRNSAGRLVVRVTQDTESLNNMFTQVIVTLVKDVLVLVGIIGVMFYMSVELTLLTLIVLPILAAIAFWYKTVIREAQRKTRTILSWLNSFLAENLSGMRITQLFVRERKQWELFHELNESYYKAGMRSSVVNSIFQPIIVLVGNLAVAGLLWYGGVRVLDSSLQFGVLFAFTIYVRQFFNPLTSLAEKYTQIQMAMVGAERIFETLDEPLGMKEAERPAALPQPLRGEIVFDRVWFAYKGEEWVLRDVSFTIRPGETAAFVGATGAGKSSIIQLLNRFYDIQQGRILLDGIDIREVPIAELRRAVGIIQQDVFLFTGTIASNIRLSEERISDEEVVEAAQQVRMDEFVRGLPEGYDTLLGERGITLSLGQRQLLSFARAIAFKPQVLILDEATSNIDTETELVVQEALANMSRGRTTLVVAHRLSTIQHADQIIVMHKGKVREIGDHAELLANRGYYFRLYELQYKARPTGGGRMQQAP